MFDNLDLGYYLVDSTLGTLCSLDTTNPDVTIEEKNAVPTNEKEVEEDSTNAYGKTNDATSVRPSTSRAPLPRRWALRTICSTTKCPQV